MAENTPQHSAPSSESLDPTEPQKPDSSSDGKASTKPGLLSHPLVHQFLTFLSTADSTALAGFFGGVIIVAYLIFGRLSLILVGAVIGAVAHATWEGYDGAGAQDDADKERVSRRREQGLEIVTRLINWQEQKRARTDIEPFVPVDDLKDQPDYSSFTPDTAAALDALTDAVIRDYVRYWYEPLVPSHSTFPLSCRAALSRFIISVSSHMSRKRPADIFLHFLTNASSMIIVFFNELSTALTSPSANAPNPSQPQSALDAIANYLMDQPESHLANVVSARQQHTKLRMVASDMLQNFLEPDLYKCEPMRLLLLNTLSEVVLESVIRSCSAPEFINGWIVYFLEEGEPELMNAIDAGVDKGSRTDPEEASLKSRASSESNIRQSTSKDRPASKTATASTDGVHRLAPISDDELRQTTKEKPSSTGEILEQTPSSTNTPGTPLTPSTDGLGDQSVGDVAAKDTIEERPSGQLTENQPPGHSNQPSPSIPDDASFSRPSLESKGGSQNSPSTINQPLVLHNAAVSILDDFPGDNTKMRAKPTNAYLLQIEPISRTGWIITRKYSDFEILHEVLRRISIVSGVNEFALKHKEMPNWKGSSVQDLRSNLELYLKDALRCEPLAESEAMRRFLEKSRDSMSGFKADSGKSAFSFPKQNVFENMGRGVLGALSNAPKGVSGGGKAVFDGVAGVFNNSAAGPGRKSTEQVPTRSSLNLKGSPVHASHQSGSSETLNTPTEASPWTPVDVTEKSADRSTTIQQPNDVMKASMEEPVMSPRLPRSNSQRLSRSSEESVQNYTPVRTKSNEGSMSSFVSTSSDDAEESGPLGDTTNTGPSLSTTANLSGQDSAGESNPRLSSDSRAEQPPKLPERPPPTKRSQDVPLSEEETRVAVELLFAVLTEMYSLSSVWNIRKKLLNASKSFLLRPGNPHIDSIRGLLQDSVVDILSSDENRAYHINKLRENSVPTKEEMDAWPAPPSDEEKENLRIRARKLLTTRGMPLALMSVMGASATEEALGRIFDSLQIEHVARGFVFAVFLQLLKAVLQ